MLICLVVMVMVVMWTSLSPSPSAHLTDLYPFLLLIGSLLLEEGPLKLD